MRNLTGIALLTLSALALTACSEHASNAQRANNEQLSPPSAAANVLPPTPMPIPPLPSPDPNEQLSKALDSLGGEQGERGHVLRLSSAQFNAGQTRFEPSDSQRIDKIVALLRDHPETHVVIQGYTDSRGSSDANRRIATERAEAARQLLVDRGIDRSRLEVQGIGEINPVADNDTAQGRQQNRRVELIFSDAQGRFASAANPTPSG